MVGGEAGVGRGLTPLSLFSISDSVTQRVLQPARGFPPLLLRRVRRSVFRPCFGLISGIGNTRHRHFLFLVLVLRALPYAVAPAALIPQVESLYGPLVNTPYRVGCPVH